tara:strand:+ start:287 stop:1084 length:798 start_codon:yes stop_codon:yes gene_type:complete
MKADFTYNFLKRNFSLKDKSIVVIGGGGHICGALSKGLAAAGATIAVLDIRLEKANNIVKYLKSNYPGNHIALQNDASIKESHKNCLDLIIKNFSKIDVLINGAGINSPTPFLEIEFDDWNKVINSQLTATMFGCQVFGEQMVNQKKGSIINISSASAGPPLSKAFAYSVAKAGIKNLTMNLAREWALEGVRVNCIRPGFFPTEWNQKNFITPERENAILSHTPMKRFGNPDELIGAAIWLASNSSSFVTGSEINIDGGFSCMTI